ncbi:hypothetical protein BGAL_0103g00270 [Botrytis galanthina]|uniref:Uncharacterized protein n=1 Tax=Botrytis galanthina TaxID=278940 RepID=A0A4S8R1Q4_9HELO|nr:hypothetical protein BGAL_0103g00270 [Botrytis galanthina]
MVASTNACWPPTIDEYFNLEWEYQGALARSGEKGSNTDKLYYINKEYNNNNKSGRAQKADLLERLEAWSEVDGTRSNAASKMLTTEFLRKHPGLADNKVLKIRMKREKEENGSEAKGKETSDKKPHMHGERPKSHTRESGRR